MLSSRPRRDERSAAITQSLVLMAGCLAVVAITASATPPAWWAARGAVLAPVVSTNDGVVTTNYVANDYAVVTQGQLKQFTARANDEMNANLPGGSGEALNDMASAWYYDYLDNGYSATNIKPSDYTAVTVGQVKYIANSVWSQLIVNGYPADMPAWLLSGTNSNLQLANLGQLKTAFNFDIELPFPAVINGLTVMPYTPGGVILSWNNYGSEPDSIEIDQSTDGGTTWTPVDTISPDASSYQISGMDPSLQYVYRVTAVSSGTSTPSSFSQQNTGTVSPPTAPPIQYAVIDLGTDKVPIALSNTGGVLAASPDLSSSFYRLTGTQTDTLTPYSPASLPRGIDNSGNVIGASGWDWSSGAPPTSFSPYPTGICVWPLGSVTPASVAVTAIGPDPGDNPLLASMANLVDYNGTIYGYTLEGNLFLNPTTYNEPNATYYIVGGVSWANASGTDAALVPCVVVDNDQISPYVTEIAAKNNHLIASVQSSTDTNYPFWDAHTDSYPEVDGNSNIDYSPADISTAGSVLGTSNTNTYLVVAVQGGVESIVPLGSAMSINHSVRYASNSPTTAVECPMMVGTGLTGDGGPTLIQKNPDTGQYDVDTIDHLIATNSGWSGFGYPLINENGVLNDGGALIGTATLTTVSGTVTTTAMHGVMLIPASITRDGQVINSTNNTVCVGQQINLTNMISGLPTNAVTSYHWTLPGNTFKDYEPNAQTSNYTNLATSDLTNSYCNFYWFDGGTNRVVTCQQVIYGQTNTVSTTLNVSAPQAGITATITGPIAADANYAGTSGITNWLYFGENIGTNNGVTFSQTNSPAPGGFTGQFRYVQTANLAITNSPSSSPNVPATVLSPSGTNIDTTFPYDYPNSAGVIAYDSPADPYLYSTTRSSSEHFQATMYLYWQAYSTNSVVNGDKTVWIPLRGVNWSWSASATNNAGTWALVPGSTNYPPNLSDFPATNQVQWSQNITNFIYTY